MNADLLNISSKQIIRRENAQALYDLSLEQLLDILPDRLSYAPDYFEHRLVITKERSQLPGREVRWNYGVCYQSDKGYFQKHKKTLREAAIEMLTSLLADEKVAILVVD